MKKFLLLALLLSACGKPGQPSPEPPVGAPGDFVVKSRAMFFISTENGVTTARRIQNFLFPIAFAANPTAVPISVVSAPNASLTADSSGLLAPTTITDTTSLGNIKITSLSDNQLKVCGSGANQKCGTALIRFYTTGTTGAGLYNTPDGYGAPISAGLSTSRAVVGLTSANAAIVQTYTIPTNKNIVKNTDFAQPMTYNIDVDFSNAGAGTYTTTLVVEFGLTL